MGMKDDVLLISISHIEYHTSIEKAKHDPSHGMAAVK